MTPRQQAARDYARAHYADPSDDDIEVDDTPGNPEGFSEGEDGTWVQAWVWVPYRDCMAAAPEGWTPD